MAQKTTSHSTSDNAAATSNRSQAPQASGEKGRGAFDLLIGAGAHFSTPCLYGVFFINRNNAAGHIDHESRETVSINT